MIVCTVGLVLCTQYDRSAYSVLHNFCLKTVRRNRYSISKPERKRKRNIKRKWGDLETECLETDYLPTTTLLPTHYLYRTEGSS